MLDIRKEERKLYAKSQLLKSLGKNDKLSKDVSLKICEETKKIKKKQMFFKKYLIANDKIRKGEN